MGQLAILLRSIDVALSHHSFHERWDFMREKHIFNFAYGLLVGGICLGFSQKDISMETIIISSLILACILGVILLLNLWNQIRWLPILLSVSAVVGAIIVFEEWMLPFAGVLLIQIADTAANNLAHKVFSGMIIILLSIIFLPQMQIILIIVLSVVPPFFIQQILQRLEICHEMLTGRSEENELLRRQLIDQRRMVQNMEHAARLHERNRLAVRIHDDVGHGISGSIILLEGAMLSLEKQPEKSKEAMAVAVENLRESVDHIRATLKEERTKRSEVGLAQIAAELSRFQADYPGIETRLETEGELGEITPSIWICVHENLTEALTNLLKHANATMFTVSISVRNKLTKVQFKDNGKSGEFKIGMGLSAMEERCALCRGRCFFPAGTRGFTIVMTFTQADHA